MKYILKEIRDNAEYADALYKGVLHRLYIDGPTSAEDMELLSFIKLLQPEVFRKHQAQVLYSLGLFYKNNLESNDIYSNVMRMYKEAITEIYGGNYTPIQADIINSILTKQFVSFSAPTSCGKSYIFMDLIKKAIRDIVIVVPSRALINEYIYKLTKAIPEKNINILPFIDKINTARCVRSIYVVTPERCRDLFFAESPYQIEMFLFDEAQLTDEDEKRGLLFDSIVRRCKRCYPNSKLLFAQPFIENPEAQISKNSLDIDNSTHCSYKERCVGQVFVSKDGQHYSYFSINRELNTQSLECEDPIANALNAGCSVLVYTPKTHIYNNSIYETYRQYIELCPELSYEILQTYIVPLQKYLGGSINDNEEHYSNILRYLKRGIVVHHGSLPLEARLIIERFVQDGLCKICFATSTLEKGVNMPFDVVLLESISQKPLRLKNLIGRAGRTDANNDFNIGIIVVNKSRKSTLRKTLREPAVLETVSFLDADTNLKDNEAELFRDAIRNETFSEEYNLPQSELAKLSSDRIQQSVSRILDLMFEGESVNLQHIEDVADEIGANLVGIFQAYWGRDLGRGEEAVLRTSNRIFIWRLKHRTFKNICHIRYAYITNAKERRRLQRQGQRTDNLKVNFAQCYFELPNKDALVNIRPLFEPSTLAKNVDYDKVVYDTYDYLDKTIGFYLSDRLYATFMKYYERTNDERAKKMAKIYKFGTYDEKAIMMMRYGLSFEDIEEIGQYVTAIDETGITVSNDFFLLPLEKRHPLERYV